MDKDPTLSEERYKAFIENIGEGVYEVDVDGNFIYFNQSMCTVLGHPREEIQWQYFGRFMDKEHSEAAKEIFTRIYRTGVGISNLIWEIVDKEGETRIIELSANLIANQEGKKVGFRGIARDVTEKFRAETALRESEWRYQCQYEASRVAEKKYRTLLEFMPYPMVVFTIKGEVTYLNPAFTQTFGWTLDELRGKSIPYVPPEYKKQTREKIKKLFEDKVLRRFETKRLTKDGRLLDVDLKGALISEDEVGATGELVLLRDITQEKRIAQSSEALIRISLALPEYPELEALLDYISDEVKRLLNVDGAMVILLDEEKKEFFFQAGAYDDKTARKRAKEIRFSVDSGVSGRVIRSGESEIVPDTAKDPDFNSVVDKRLGVHAENLLVVPLRSRERIIGVLNAINKSDGTFDHKDVELLGMIASTVALSIENARYAKEITEAYNEVIGLNRAKDKVINHLSHELKTPVSILMASLNILKKRLTKLPEDTWQPTIERARRNLDRILEIQYQVEDIMEEHDFKAYDLLSLLLQQCEDELEALVAEEAGEGPIVERVRQRIEEIFGPKESKISEISLKDFVEERVESLKTLFPHREIDLILQTGDTPEICVPIDVLQKVVDGLIKNAVEATPDEGKIEVTVRGRGEGAEFQVEDYGIGITEEDQRRIFEGFFSTQETMNYSSKRPFDFNAGGKGADLLRMKIFAERYNFNLTMESKRCQFIPEEENICPGKISECEFCKEKADCHRSGGSTFSVFFHPSPEKGCEMSKPS